MQTASAQHIRTKTQSVTFVALCLYVVGLVFCVLPTTAWAQAADNSDATSAPASASAFAFTSTAPANTAPSTPTPSTTTSTAPAIEVSAEGSAARVIDGTLGITDFSRSHKGTNKTYEDTYFGYRFPMAGPDAFAVIVIDEHTSLVYLPAAQAQTVRDKPNDTEAFIALLEALDEVAASGGTPLNSLAITYEFTSEPSVERGAYRYDFAREVEPGYFYACVTENGSEDGSGGALFALSGRIASAGEVTITQNPEGWAAVAAFFSSLDARPFWVSLRTAGVAMLFVFVLGLLAAWFSQRINSRLKGVLDSLFTIPMVLPPTVCGFLLLVVFGKSTGFGHWLIDHGIELVFSWPAAVLAAVIVAFPLMYRTARGAFEALDPTLGDAARTLGWSERRIFFRLVLPLSWPSIAAGTVLAFARAIGEFGATLFVAGNYPGVTQTMPIAIYFQWMGGHPEIAAFWVGVVILISFIVILFINWYAARTQRYRRPTADEMESGGGEL